MDAEDNGHYGQAAEEKIIKNDVLQWLRIFPEEIWHTIYDKLDAETVENLSNSSLYFRTLWLSRRTLFLFPKVLQIISERHRKKGFCNNGDYKREKQTTMRGFSRRHAYPGSCCDRTCLPFFTCGHESTKLRLVCKSWNKAFDKCCRLPDHDTIEEHERNHPAVRKVVNYGFDHKEFKDGVRTAARFLHHFESTHAGGNQSRSPFVGNSVRVLYAGSDQRKTDCRFFEGIVELTSKYGEHVRHLSLVEKVNVFYMQGYSKLRTILEAMPHLESLDIKHYYYTQNHTFHPDPYPPSYRQLTQFIELNPLPQLRRLQCIKLAGNGSAPSIFREIVCKYNHISKLIISDISIAEYDLLATPLSNLKELSLVLYKEKDLIALEDARLNWPLTKLGLSFGAHVRFESVNWSKVFSVVENKWTETLTELSLAFPRRAQKCINAVSASINLKHVKRLELKFFFYLSLDFILPLKDTLEYLSVVDVSKFTKCWGMGVTGTTVEKEANIKFWTWNGNMLKSNVWTHFPKLRRVKFFCCPEGRSDIPISAVADKKDVQ